MIRQHQSLKRSEKIVKSLVDKLNKDKIGIDGVYEVFCTKDLKQGYMIKIFKNFSDNDLCIWMYEPFKEGLIETAIGNKSSCGENNNWIENENLEFKRYPIKKHILRDIVNDLEEIILKEYELERNFKF